MSSHHVSSSAWKSSQWFAFFVSSHALRLTGASPKPSATAACASGEAMWFIQRYMQFGLAALDETIHVSDQPVVPSFGLIAFTGTSAFCSCRYWYGHVVPTTLSPFVYDPICFTTSPGQYSPTFGACFFSSATAASNC